MLAYAAGLLLGLVVGAVLLVVEWATRHRRKRALRRRGLAFLI
jgi:hypothetical protein